MKTIWIVDGAYLMKMAIVHFNYLKLKHLLEAKTGCRFAESYYLSSIDPNNPNAQDTFLAWLQSPEPDGPELRLKLYSLKQGAHECNRCGALVDYRLQKGVDVGIATLIVSLAIQHRYDRLVLCTGDGDFEDAVRFVKDVLHKEIWMCGFKRSISTDLQSYSDEIIWLNEYTAEIRKELAEW